MADELFGEPLTDSEPELGFDAGRTSHSLGHREVDAVVERLDELDGLAISEHPEVFEDAHRRLHETLTAAGTGDAHYRGSGPGSGVPEPGPGSQ